MRLIKSTLNELIENPKKFGEKLTIDKLVSVLKKLSDVYYNTGTSLVSDAVFDKLKDVLQKREPKHPYLSEVGAPVKGTKNKVQLPFPMGSLDKVKPTEGKLEPWIKTYPGPYVLSDKMDGGSVQLYKNEKGELKMYSRGKDVEGQDIGHLIGYVNIPKKAIQNLPNSTSVRGEFVISKANFTKITDKENARNTVAGIINAKTPDLKIAKLIDFMTYAILSPRELQSKQMETLEKWGFDVAPYKIVNSLTEQYLMDYFKERREKSKYEIDGIVCVDNSKVYVNEGGFPDFAFAFKMDLDEQQTIATVVDVIWDPSMDMYLKPVIKIKPVKLVGVTVTYATAHNAKMVVDNKIGVGAEIKIIRSGDVIPKILEVIKPAKETKLPTMKYKWNKTNVDFVIVNPDPETMRLVNIKRSVHFFKTIRAKYISEGIITKMAKHGYDTVFKILEVNRSKLETIEGIGNKSVTKIFAEIEKAMAKVSLAVFMSATHEFGRNLGSRKLQEVINKYPNILTDKMSQDELKENVMTVPGFSDKLASKFATNLEKFMIYYNRITKLYDLTRFLVIKKTTVGTRFKDNTIVFTGFRDEELKQYIINNGGKVTDSVSKKTTIVVYEVVSSGSAKITDAKKMGIQTMSRKEFKDKYVT